LHRFALTLSNGGSLPYVKSLECFAAAVARESAWHVLGPLPGDTLNEDEPAYKPFKPLILGEPLGALLTNAGIDIQRYRSPGVKIESFIVMGLGYFDTDGFFCYSREDPGPIYAVGTEEYGTYKLARDFDTFLRNHVLFPMCETPAFRARMREVFDRDE
jgi:hypothetical protein